MTIAVIVAGARVVRAKELVTALLAGTKPSISKDI